MDFEKIKINIQVNSIRGIELYEETNFESIKYKAYQLMDDMDFDGCLSFTKSLENKLKDYKVQSSYEAYLKSVYEFWIQRIKLFAFASLNLQEMNDIFKSNLLKIINFDLDLKSAVLNFFDFYNNTESVNSFSQSFLIAITSNKEILGSLDLFSEEKDFRPTIGIWIQEYQSVLIGELGSVTKKPGTFHILKFIDTNVYAKKISNQDKTKLKMVLDLYNWLLDPKVSSTEQEKLPRYIQKQKLSIPESIRSSIPTAPVVAKPFTPPVVPKVKPVNLAEIMKNKDKIDLGGGSGIRFGGQESNQSISQSANQKNLQGEQKPKAQVDIEKKLEDLKKRKGSKLT